MKLRLAAVAVVLGLVLPRQAQGMQFHFDHCPEEWKGPYRQAIIDSYHMVVTVNQALTNLHDGVSVEMSINNSVTTELIRRWFGSDVIPMPKKKNPRFRKMHDIFKLAEWFLEPVAPLISCKFDDSDVHGICQLHPETKAYTSIGWTIVYLCKSAATVNATWLDTQAIINSDNADKYLVAHKTSVAKLLMQQVTKLQKVRKIAGTFDFELEKIRSGPRVPGMKYCFGPVCAHWLAQHLPSAAIGSSENYAGFFLEIAMAEAGYVAPEWKPEPSVWPEGCRDMVTAEDLSSCLEHRAAHRDLNSDPWHPNNLSLSHVDGPLSNKTI